MAELSPYLQQKAAEARAAREASVPADNGTNTVSGTSVLSPYLQQKAAEARATKETSVSGNSGVGKIADNLFSSSSSKSPLQASSLQSNLKQALLSGSASETTELSSQISESDDTTSAAGLSYRQMELEDEISALQTQRNSMASVGSGGYNPNDRSATQAHQAEIRALDEQISVLNNELSSVKSARYEAEMGETLAALDPVLAEDLLQSAYAQAELAELSDITTLMHRGGSGINSPAGREVFNAQVNERIAQAAALEASIQSVRDSLAAAGYSEDDTDSLMNYAERQYNKTAYEQTLAESAALAGDSPLPASAQSVGLNIVSGLGYLDMLSQQVTNWLKGDDTPLDYYSPLMQLSGSANEIRATVARGLEEKYSTNVAGVNIASFLYQTGMSMADFLAAFAVGGNSAVLLLGGSAATTATADAAERGATDGQALMTGLIAGAAEIVFEKVSLDSLVTLSRAGTLQSTIKNVLKQAGVEASEEVFTTIANTMADAVIMGDKSSLKLRRSELISAGVSKDEAYTQAMTEWFVSLCSDAMGGFVSGGTLGTVSSGKTVLSGSFADAPLGASLSEESRIQLTQLAAELDEKSAAYKAAESVSGDSTDRAYGKLARLAGGEIADLSDSSPETALLQERFEAILAGEVAPERTQTAAQEAAGRAEAFAGETTPAAAVTAGSGAQAAGYTGQSGVTYNAVQAQALSSLSDAELSAGLDSLAYGQDVYVSDLGLDDAKVQALRDAGLITTINAVAPGGSVDFDVDTININALADEQFRRAALTEGSIAYGAEVQSVTGGQPPAAADAGAGGTLPDGDYGRLFGTGSGQQARFVDTGTAAAGGQATDQRRTAIDRQSRARDLNVDTTSSRELGLTRGTDSRLVKVLPEASWDDAMRATAERVYQETGIVPTFVVGTIEIMGEGGETRLVEGVFAVNKMVLRSNSMKYTIDQLADHEIYHAKAARTPSLNEDVRQFILDEGGEASLESTYEAYVRKLEGVIDVYEGMDGDALARARADVMEEIFADAYAGMNKFGAGATAFSSVADTVLEGRGEARLAGQEANGVRETRGPPTSSTQAPLSPAPPQAGELARSAASPLPDKPASAGLRPDNGGIDGDYLQQLSGAYENGEISDAEFDRLFDEYYDDFYGDYVGGEESQLYSISDSFADEIDNWDGKQRVGFRVGTTSAALRSIGIQDRNVIWYSRKVGEVLRKHQGMTREVIKQVPEILEHPIAVVKSNQSDSRVAIFGEVTDANGAPVTAILELQPTTRGGEILNMNVIASAYGKDSNPAGFVRNSELLYLDKNKNRTERWLQSFGLQLPSDATAFGSIGTISYQDGNVKIEGVPYSQYMEDQRFSVNARTVGNGESQRYSISDSFADDVQTWYETTTDTDRMTSPGYFTVGTTSQPLKDIGVRDVNIYWRKSKIGYILNEHPETDIGTLEKVPEILENPVVVMKSRTRGDSIVLFGELRAANGQDVMASLELTPASGGDMEAEFSLVTSAYGRSEANIRNLIESSEILYLDPNKNRTEAWLMHLRVQFPSGQPALGPIGTVSYQDGNVKIEGVPYSQYMRDQRFSVSDDAEVQSGGEYAGAEARYHEAVSGNVMLGRAVDMVREGALPSRVYIETGMAVMANGDITDGIGGQLLLSGSDVRMLSEGGESRGLFGSEEAVPGGYPGNDNESRQLEATGRESSSEFGANRALSGERDSSGEVSWRVLGDDTRRRLINYLDEVFTSDSGGYAEFMLDVFNDGANGDLATAEQILAERIFDNLDQHDVVLERELSNYFERPSEVIQFFRDEAGQAGGGNRYSAGDAPSAADALPAKAREYLRRAERTLINKISSALSVPRFAQRSYLNGIVRDISNEYLNNGTVSQETVDALFDRAYDEGVEVDSEFYDQYKHLRTQLRNQAVTISKHDQADIADFSIFKKSAFGILNIVNEGGLPVDTLYMELQDSAPELFPDSITHPADQLQRMYDVARSITVTKRTLDEYYGPDAEDFRAWAKNDFEAAVNNIMSELKIVNRYADERSGTEVDTAAPEMTQDEVADLYAELKDARRVYERTAAKHLLTDYDNAQVSRLLKGEIELSELDSSRVNVKGVTAVYEAKREYERLAGKIREYNNARKAALRAEADGYIETADDWKDKKSGIQYSRETMERNIRDIVPDMDIASDIIRAYFQPVHDAQASSTRMKDEFRDRVRELGLSRKVADGNLVSEAHAVQLLGEAQDNIEVLERSRGRVKERDGKTLSEWRELVSGLWTENPNLDRQKVESAISSFRSIYDELFRQMNESRVRNGYEPVNYRRGYFPHFQPGEGDGILSQFGRALDIETQVTALPTTINGLTHTFKPGIQWFGNSQERLGFATAYDAVEGFDKYIEGVADVIHQTDNIQRLRALASQIRYRGSDQAIRDRVDGIRSNSELSEAEKQTLIDEVYEKGKYSLSKFVVELEEYTNLLANKKSTLDRGAERNIGRTKIYNFMKWFESRVAANMVAVNPASWLTNFIPLTQGGAQLERGMLIKGMWDTLRAYNTDDGIVSKSSFLTNRRGSDPIVKTWAQAASAKASAGMEYIDQFTADSLVRARYQQNLKQGLSEAEAMSEADLWAAGVMADRSKGSMPTLFAAMNPIIKPFTQFQLEVNNQLSYLFKDLPREQKEKGLGALAAALLKFFLGAFFYNEVYEYFIGRRPALDPIGILNDTVGDWTGYELPNLVEMGVGLLTGDMPSFETEKAGTYDSLANLVENVAEELPFASILSLFGFDVDAGRVPISSAVPDISALAKAAANSDWDDKKRMKEVWDEVKKILTYSVLPFGGGQLKKIAEGAYATARGGSYSVDNDGNDILQYPVYNDTPAETVMSLLQAIVFGKTSLSAGQDWIDSGFDSFTAKETAAYIGMMEAGISNREAYELVSELSSAVKTETESEATIKRQIIRDSDVAGEGKSVAYYSLLAGEKEQELMDSLANSGADMGEVTNVLMDIKDAGTLKGTAASAAKLEAISSAKLTDKVKLAIYEGLVTDGSVSQNEKIEAITGAGMSLGQFFKIQTAYNEIYRGDSTSEEAVKAVEFSRWVNKQDYTDEQAAAIREAFSTSKTYDELNAAGLSEQLSYDLTYALAALEPAEGAIAITDLQKCRVAVSVASDAEDQLKALSVVMGSNESAFAKVEIVYDYNMPPSYYVTYRELLLENDLDGNGSFTQAETETAIYRMAGLTQTERAVLWQITNKSWSAKNNPFSTSVGTAVYNRLNGNATSDETSSLLAKWGLG